MTRDGFALSSVHAQALASALALLLASPMLAQAQPSRKQPAPESSAAMQACPEFGPGFFRQPGSSTCVKISGFDRGEVRVRDRRSEVFTPAPLSGGSTRIQPAARADLRLEAVSSTANGPFRAVVEVRGLHPGGGH
jgi:hypothetical protein